MAFLIYIWIFSLAAEDTQELTAKPGEDVPLQCRGPRGASISLIEWSRPDLKSDQYVFLFRDDHPNENYQLPSFRGRVELRDPEMKDGDASVVLKNVIINDSVTYECEMLWHDLKKAVHARKPSNMAELQQFCKDEWAKTPPQRCKRLIASYRKRLVAVVAAKGGATSFIVFSSTSPVCTDVKASYCNKEFPYGDQ